MHEMALCRTVVDMVLEEADKVGAQRVSGVYLTVGYSRDIVESLFDDVFKWLGRDEFRREARVGRFPLGRLIWNLV